MRYNGGKHRIADAVTDAILARRGTRSVFVEPFMGGANITVKMSREFDISIATDVVPDLVKLWQSVKAGWVPPAEVSEWEWRMLRSFIGPPSAERAFAGFACSFGSKWFAGYARSGAGSKQQDYAGSGGRGIEKKRRGIEAVTYIGCQDYRTHTTIMGPAVVAYCDPPYAGTTGYKAAGGFDNDQFWDVMRSWVAAGALVFVSEYVAPEDWIEVGHWTPQASLSKDDKSKKVNEYLFVHRSQA